MDRRDFLRTSAAWRVVALAANHTSRTACMPQGKRTLTMVHRLAPWLFAVARCTLPPILEQIWLTKCLTAR